MTEHVVKRWTRYGHDRLYVETCAGTRLGYRDSKTALSVADDTAHLSTVEAAAAAFKGARRPR